MIVKVAQHCSPGTDSADSHCAHLVNYSATSPLSKHPLELVVMDNVLCVQVHAFYVDVDADASAECARVFAAEPARRDVIVFDALALGLVFA